MKKTQTKRVTSDQLRTEYEFDYNKAKANRFAGRAGKLCTVAVLDEDVSKVFSDSTSVNTALRALIAALPKKAR